MSSNDKVKHLNIVKRPTVSEEARREVVEILSELLDKAKAGEISEIAVITANGDLWEERTSPTISVTTWLGRLAILQADWVASYKAIRDGE